MKVKYPYIGDGYDKLGKRLPDIPILWMELVSPIGRRLRGPCLIDTGFDGALYANEDLALNLEGLSPTRTDELYALGGHEIKCEVFSVEGYLTTPEGRGRFYKLGVVEVYVPLTPGELSAEVVVGREVVNRLLLTLTGKEVTVLCR